MRTCLSSFSDFFKDLACVPHDTVKNVEETTPPGLTEVKDSNPENSLAEKDDQDQQDEVEDVDSVYQETSSIPRRATVLEACLILAPLILGAMYSYMMTSMIYHK
jgi:hypothetical protein